MGTLGVREDEMSLMMSTLRNENAWNGQNGRKNGVIEHWKIDV